LNSDSRYYGGSNVGNETATAEPTPCMDQPYSIVISLPPLGGLVLVPA
jgi:1,4-alpha-glucan branching enzyme